jgi:DNA-3-methyladenine glycosylase II
MASPHRRTAPRALTAGSIGAAVKALRAADAKLARAIDSVGPCTLLPRRDGTHFDHLARAIVYQQLSGSAAATIYGRFSVHCGGGAPPSPEAVLAQDVATLRACGLSGAKTAAIVDLAQHVVDQRLPLDALDDMEDEAVIESLVQVRGVGRWTAQMFLMFRLGRPDVLPVLDLGVRKGAQRIYNMRALPDADRLEKVARAWRPWASIASWYCWRVLDMENGGTW